MNTATQPVAVFGATGVQGGAVARFLIDAGQPVRAIGRSAEKLRDLAARGAELFAADLADAAALQRALEGVGGVFVYLPFVPVMELMQAWARAVSDALVAAAVPLTVFTSSGPVPAEPVGVASFDTRAAAVAILRASGAPIVFFEPTLYLGNLSAPFSAPSVVRDSELRYPPVPSDLRLAWVSVEDQAALAAAALRRPDLAGRTFRLGARLTGHDIAAAVGDGLGRPVRHAPMSLAAFVDSLVPFLGPQAAQALADDYAAIADQPAALRLDTDSGAINAELGVPLTPVADWVRTQDWAGMAAIALAGRP